MWGRTKPVIGTRFFSGSGTLLPQDVYIPPVNTTVFLPITDVSSEMKEILAVRQEDVVSSIQGNTYLNTRFEINPFPVASKKEQEEKVSAKKARALFFENRREATDRANVQILIMPAGATSFGRGHEIGADREKRTGALFLYDKIIRENLSPSVAEEIREAFEEQSKTKLSLIFAPTLFVCIGLGGMPPTTYTKEHQWGEHYETVYAVISNKERKYFDSLKDAYPGLTVLPEDNKVAFNNYMLGILREFYQKWERHHFIQEAHRQFRR